MSPEAYAAIKALNSGVTFLPGSYDKRFVGDLSSKSLEDDLTAKQEAFLKLTTWRYRRQILARNPDFDMSWTLDHPDVMGAIWRKRNRRAKRAGDKDAAALIEERRAAGTLPDKLRDWWLK